MRIWNISENSDDSARLPAITLVKQRRERIYDFFFRISRSSSLNKRNLQETKNRVGSASGTIEAGNSLSRLHCNCPFFEREYWRARTSIARDNAKSESNQTGGKLRYVTVALRLIQFEMAKNISENISLLLSTMSKSIGKGKIPLCNVQKSKDMYSYEILALQIAISNKFHSESKFSIRNSITESYVVSEIIIFR